MLQYLDQTHANIIEANRIDEFSNRHQQYKFEMHRLYYHICIDSINPSLLVHDTLDNVFQIISNFYLIGRWDTNDRQRQIVAQNDKLLLIQYLSYAVGQHVKEGGQSHALRRFIQNTRSLTTLSDKLRDQLTPWQFHVEYTELPKTSADDTAAVGAKNLRLYIKIYSTI